MSNPTIRSRGLLVIVMTVLLLILTACPLPTAVGGRTAANPSNKGGAPAATRAVEEAVAKEDEESDAERDDPSTPFVTPTPGPTATPTPEPLAVADPERATQLTDEAKTLFLASDLAGAESKAIEAIAADPQYVPAYLQLTDIYLYWPHYWQQALETAETAAKLAPEDPVALAYLAWAQQGAHLFDKAKASALRAVELGPDVAVAHQALADVLSSVYELDSAYEHAQEAVALDEESASAWASVGSIATTLEYPDEAAAAYERAVELEPDFFAWHILLARHELNVSGDVETARELAAPAYDLQPDHPFVLSFTVDTALENNEWDLAEEACLRLTAYNQPATPYPDAYSCLASVRLSQEDNQGAEFYQELAEAIAPPQRLDITVLRMRLLNDEEQCAESRALAEAWLEERPYSVLALRMIGVSYLCDEEFEAAADYFQQALAVMPRSIADARLLANAYARDDKAAQARAALNQIRAFAANTPLYYQALYEVHLFLGQTKEAISAAQRWQVLRPNNTEAMSSLALAELFNNNPGAAQSHAQNALDAGATGATLYAILGESYARQGNFEEGEEYLLQALAINDEHFLARNFIAQLYLFSGECDKAEPHIDWLKGESTDEDDDSIAQYEAFLAECRRRAAIETPDPETALADDAVLSEVENALEAAGVQSQVVRFAEEGGKRTLFVAYTSNLAVDSDEFAEEERALALELARLLPLISSQPDGLILLSGVTDEPQNILFIATQAAFRWASGELTDEEFEETWLKQSAGELEE